MQLLDATTGCSYWMLSVVSGDLYWMQLLDAAGISENLLDANYWMQLEFRRTYWMQLLDAFSSFGELYWMQLLDAA